LLRLQKGRAFVKEPESVRQARAVRRCILVRCKVRMGEQEGTCPAHNGWDIYATQNRLDL
jgi:hypothetical protein